jgi:hypothetical protein
MNTLRIGVIAIWTAVGVIGYLSLRGAATDEAPPAKVTRARSTPATGEQPPISMATDRSGRPANHALDVHTLGTAIEPDSSDLKQPAPTLNQVFDALNADIGPEGEYVDPRVLAEVLRSDTELNRLVNE